jgi:hypothetical protein
MNKYIQDQNVSITIGWRNKAFIHKVPVSYNHRQTSDILKVNLWYFHKRLTVVTRHGLCGPLTQITLSCTLFQHWNSTCHNVIIWGNKRCLSFAVKFNWKEHLLLFQESGQLTRYNDGLRASGFDFQQGQEIFLHPTMSRPALGPNQPHIQWVPGAFPGSKAAGREADNVPSSSTKSRMVDLYLHSLIRPHGVMFN